jgi:hypothetical protein
VAVGAMVVSSVGMSSSQLNHVVDDLLESLWWFAASTCLLLLDLACADD